MEHTIFHASELFPSEGFAHFLSQKGGSNNAFTASTYTNFHFDIPKEHFLDALDRSVMIWYSRKVFPSKLSKVYFDEFHVDNANDITFLLILDLEVQND